MPAKNLRTKEAANYTGLSSSLLEKLRVFGGGPAYLKIGRAVVYNTADLDLWLSGHRCAHTSQRSAA